MGEISRVVSETWKSTKESKLDSSLAYHVDKGFGCLLMLIPILGILLLIVIGFAIWGWMR